MSRRPTSLPSSQIDAAAADWIIRRDAGLTDAEKAAFTSWQAEDPRHAAAVTRHDQAWSMLDHPRSNGTAVELEQALGRRSARRTRRRLAATSLVAVLLLAGLFWIWPGSQPGGSPVSTAIVLNPELQTLPDGTRVEVRSGASLAVDFSGPLRRVTLQRGEALFQVAKDPQRAFVVSAAGVEVRAVGTAFLVGVGGAGVDVIVTEGKVAVRTGPASSMPEGNNLVSPSEAPAPATYVDAGRRLMVGLAPGQVTAEPTEISNAELSDRLAWRATRLEFSYTPLAEAIALMNQHSQVRLVIDDPDLATLPVNGLFRADNSATLLRLLEANFEVSSTREGDVITLRRLRK
ncbi:MAG: FecR domain-containing protein [Opitutaceae bacterium]|nr:FecR domain-containing protein [Opitutaceae bacterium]